MVIPAFTTENLESLSPPLQYFEARLHIESFA